MVPDIEETFGYGMPVFKYNGKYLIGMCNFKNHMSIFPGDGVTNSLETELLPYKLSKDTVQFTLDKPITTVLLRKVVMHRIKVINSY